MSENLNVHGLKSAFGELSVARNTPQFQGGFVYGVDSEIYLALTDASPGTGTVTSADSMALCQTGAGDGGSAAVWSRRFLQYKHGQGGIARFTALFSPGVAGSEQRAGLGSLENKLFIGYNGTSFGVNRRTGGLAEIRTLTVTDGTGSGVADITLNGELFNPTLTATTTAARAREIAAGATYTGWTAEAIGSTVVFLADSTGARSGAYSLATVGAGTFAQTRAGASDTDNWVYQADFNVDTLDGTGPSGINIDPSKGNVYEIKYQWLGYGAISFWVEDQVSGNLVEFHRMQYSNQYTTPSLSNPAMHIEIAAESLGSTANVSVKSASMAAFIQGDSDHRGKQYAVNQSASTGSTSLVPLVSIKPSNVFRGSINFAEAHLRLLSIATSSAGSKPGVFEIRRNATLTGEQWVYVNENMSGIIKDASATAMSGGELIMAFSLPSTGSQIVDLSPLGAYINRYDAITIGIRSVTGTIEFSASLTWEEDY